jgi:hypothetical protein
LRHVELVAVEQTNRCQHFFVILSRWLRFPRRQRARSAALYDVTQQLFWWMRQRSAACSCFEDAQVQFCAAIVAIGLKRLSQSRASK